MDIIDDYEGQVLCDPTPKPGTLKLRDALWAAYGRDIWAGISRDCNVAWDTGVSEHKDGRAIDWGVSIRKPNRAIGDEFVAWATANNGEMARRMGIMYLIWDSKMWRTYGMDRGWTEYQSCVTVNTAVAQDTTCHRDHMHISLTWHGAAASTSWYDGTAVLTKGCGAGNPIAAKAGSASAPAVMFDPLKGVGTARGCYLDNSIQTLKLPSPGGAAFVQRLRVTELSLNAPTSVRIWSNAKDSLTIRGSAAVPAEYDLAVAADGLVYIQLPAGQGSVRIEGLGQTDGKKYRAFVAQAYRDVLGREGDAGGVDGWTAAVMAGAVSTHGLIQALNYSAEGSQRTATSLYRSILARDPEPAGRAGWSAVISRRDMKVKDARVAFWASGERVAKSGSLTQWVSDLYQSELGRAADAGGLAGWTQVAATQGATAAAAGILRSPEWLQRQVAEQYQLMLKRAPEAGAAAGWAPTLAQTDIPILQSYLGGSPEYFARAPA